jgi:integrase
VITTRGKKPPADIIVAAEHKMTTVNRCSIPVDQVITFAEFIETVFLPSAKEIKKPSTARGYESLWRLYLKPLVTSEKGTLIKDIRCATVQRWLDNVSQKDLARNTLQRVKAFLSGAFKEARRLGYLDTENPAKDCRVNPHSRPPAKTYAYSLEEIFAILSILPEPAATVFVVASFAGLRRGELEGLEWPDLHDGHLWVTRSIWNGEVLVPKTEMSASPVPAIKQVAERLELHRVRSGNPDSGPIFRNVLNSYMSMNNQVNRIIRPALDHCRHCGISQGKAHRKQDHVFERDPKRPVWHGFHAARRGLGSNLYRLGVPDKTIQAILRHSNVSVTLGYYVKSSSPDVLAGMNKLEDAAEMLEKSAMQDLRDSNRTPKPDPGAMPGFVN